MNKIETNIIICGDSKEVLKKMPNNSIHLCCTDGPYMIDFMGKEFDKSKDNIVEDIDFWKEVLRVLKPGGYLLSFGGTRTYHRMVTAVEKAGFEIRDMIEWVYASGFPKSLNVQKSMKKRGLNGSAWKGYGTALKPAHEPICVARKPLSEKSVVDNVLKWGTGSLNIDDCRIPYESEDAKSQVGSTKKYKSGFSSVKGWQKGNDNVVIGNKQGRFPANILVQDDVLNDGRITKSISHLRKNKVGSKIYGGGQGIPPINDPSGPHDSGSFSRYFDLDKWYEKQIKSIK